MKFRSNGTFNGWWGSYGTEDGQFKNPEGVAVDSSGNVYVAYWNYNKIQKFGKYVPPVPDPVDPVVPPLPNTTTTAGRQTNPADGAITYQLNSMTAAEDVGSQYDHLMILREVTNYDLRTKP